MTTSDYALFISLAALVIALAALIWNVWQKFIFVKPNLQVTFGIGKVLEPTSDIEFEATNKKLLVLIVTNIGPGPVILYACIVKTKKKWWHLHTQTGMINPIHNNPLYPTPISLGPFSAGLPIKIDSGEMKSFYFPYERDSMLAHNVLKIGINDTYQRNSWCRSKDIKKAYLSYRTDFATYTD